MQSGDVWQFTLLHPQPTTCYLRVVLAVADLGVRLPNQLEFVRQSWLIQVSKDQELAPDSFSKKKLLVNGAFLEREGPWGKHDFERVGRRPVSVEDVEFPCWFDDMDSGLFLCRGQLKFKISRRQFGKSVEEWDILQSPLNPLLLRKHLLTPSLEESAEFGDGDLRYSPLRQEILSALGLEVSKPYWKALEEASPSALKRCQRAIGG